MELVHRLIAVIRRSETTEDDLDIYALPDNESP